MPKILKDRFGLKDTPLPAVSNGGLWAKTEVIGGYGDVIVNPNGKSSLSETMFEQHNIVPIGGVSYAMQNIFSVSDSQISYPTLYSMHKIGLPDTGYPTETYQTPNGDRKIIYRYGHCVQLFAVGITGTGESDVTVYNPDYRENGITLTKTNSDGLKVTGTMIPFRYTSEMLNASERKQYFGKLKNTNTGETAYYLKKFESDAVIKHVWKTGEDVDNETLVTESEVWENTSGLNAVETFTEIILKISKKDIKEWFLALDQEDRTRINTIALFNGRYVKDNSNPADYGDYEDVRLFSKLCIHPEYLTLAKDFNIIYRVYGS